MKQIRAAELDALDRSILERYQSDTRRSAEQLGEDVGLSTAAVHRRLKRLRDDGVIRAEVAVLDPVAVGLAQTCIVAVGLEREGLVELERFQARMRALAVVQQCYYVTGEADFVLVVAVADMAAYETFTRAHLLSDPNVRRFTTHVVMERVKAGLALPVG